MNASAAYTKALEAAKSLGDAEKIIERLRHNKQRPLKRYR
jgi:hypothetical protein